MLLRPRNNASVNTSCWNYSSCKSDMRVSACGSRFFLLRELRLDLEDLPFFETRFSTRLLSFAICLNGRSGGASGHGVRFAGTTISRGGSITHLQTKKIPIS